MIQIQNVMFKYQDTIALQQINLEIGNGESVAVIGANGSGKSTLLKLIGGLVFPIQGHYYNDGIEINQKKMQDNKFSKVFYKKVGFVFQNPDVQLFCTSVFEEVAFGPRQMGFSESEVEQRVKDCLQLLGIEELKNRVPYHLSGGEKKKVAIASVLANNPEVLLLDEPMNGLDPKSKRFLRDFLIELNGYGKTIICATHDFEYVDSVFKRAIVFSQQHDITKDDDYEKVISDKHFLVTQNII